VSGWEELLATVAAGVGTGVTSSFAIWWWLGRRMRPQVMICPTLATFISADGGRRTQFRVRNPGRRDAYEVSIRVSLRMPSLIAPGVIEWALLQESFVTVLPAGKSRRWSIRPERAEGIRNYANALPAPLRQRYAAGSEIHLADLIGEIPRASVRVAVFATDSYSGTRGYVEETFSVDAIETGRFLGEGCDHADSVDWLRGDPRPRAQ
jgi:hypothetical protein